MNWGVWVWDVIVRPLRGRGGGGRVTTGCSLRSLTRGYSYSAPLGPGETENYESGIKNYELGMGEGGIENYELGITNCGLGMGEGGGENYELGITNYELGYEERRWAEETGTDGVRG